MCHICRMSHVFPERAIFAALWTHSKVDAHAVSEGCWATGDLILKKIVIVAAATLAMVVAAGAADLPHPQPVYQTAQVGKTPIGKSPIGKSPIGKTPVAGRY